MFSISVSALSDSHIISMCLLFLLFLFCLMFLSSYYNRKENNERMPASEREMMEMQAEDVRIRALYKDRYIELCYSYYYLLNSIYYFW